MKAIFKREFSAYIHSVVGLLFMAVTVFFFGLYGAVYNLASGYPYVSYTLSAILFLFLLTIPILSMRILADEKKQKTDQLILTAPVSVGKIVLGKYFAMAAIFLIPVAGMCIFPLFLSRFGTVPMAESYAAILAFALYGLTCMAVGILVSSFTESQVIAAVLSFAILFITYMMQGIESLISQTGNVVTKFLSIFDFQTRFSNMVNGVFDVTSVIYFVSVIALLLFLTTQSIQKRRYSVSVHNISMGAYSSITVVIGIALTVVVNLIVSQLPTKYTSFDITENQLYTITDQTREMLGNLTEDVTVYVLSSEDNADTTVAQTLKGYEEESSHVKVEYIDPLVNPQFASSYSTTNLSQNSLIVETSKRYKVISYSDMYETEIDYSTYSQNVTGYDGEGQLTSAIAYCTSDDMPKVYMITGHNEYTLDSGFTTALEKENIDYETISLMEYDAIPEDAECIIIHAPEKDFSEDDANKVIEYLNNGGKALITTEYVDTQMPNFEKILSEFGLIIQSGYAVDTNAGNYYQTPIYLLPNVEYSDETTGLTESHTYVMAPYAEGIAVPDVDVENITYTKLLTTSESSLLKTDVKNAASFEKEEGDIDGPLCIGVKAEKALDSGSAVMYVFSSAQFFTDNVDNAVSGNNKKLFTNIMSTIASHDVSVSVPVKSYSYDNLTASTKDVVLFETVVVILIPLALIIIGFVIWFKRRKK